MGLFDSAEEAARKANLKNLEDKRVAFANRLQSQGFAPERMLFAQNDNGGFTALARVNGKPWLVISPGFGTDEEFVLVQLDALDYRVEEIHVPAEGMGGIFGFGKKPEDGAEYIIALPDGGVAHMPFVAGRGGWLDIKKSKNPLLKTQRRRGDANVVWDLKPLDRGTVNAALAVAKTYFDQ